MRYVFLDTNILIACALMHGHDDKPMLLEQLAAALRSHGDQLLLPEVVRAEFARNLEIKWEWQKARIQSFRRTLLANAELLAASDRATIAAHVDAIRQELAERIQEHEDAKSAAGKIIDTLFGDDSLTTIIPLSSDNMVDALRMTLGRTKPSKAGKDMYGQPSTSADDVLGMRFRYGIEADCLIVAALAEFCSVHGVQELTLCSANTSDFALKNPVRLHPSIAAVLPTGTRYFSSLPELLRTEYQSTAIPAEVEVDYDDSASDIASFDSLAAAQASIGNAGLGPGALAALAAASASLASIGLSPSARAAIAAGHASIGNAGLGAASRSQEPDAPATASDDEEVPPSK